MINNIVQAERTALLIPHRPQRTSNTYRSWLVPCAVFASILLFVYASWAPQVLVREYPNSEPLNGPLSPWLHDPGIAKGPSGTYVLASTGAGLPLRTSTDRVNWIDGGMVFPEGNPSATEEFTGARWSVLWAPDVTYVNGSWWVYYAASSLGSQKSGIFLARSETGLNGTWKDHGLVISSSSSVNWNAIDPNLAIDGDKWYLVFGSYWGGIKLLALDPATGLAKNPANSLIGLSRRYEDNGSEEAPFLFHNGPHWFLFTSWGSCCAGNSSTYSIHVSRSPSIQGPFVDRDGILAIDGGGTEILASHGTIYGPGGQSVFLDEDGPVLVYHYSAQRPHMYNLGLNRLSFKTGWPVVI
ncbi:endo-1,5-alpha-L-arabinosidase [Meredithblackwellia eburnea MCA 4105]